jgi:hypothetical protein
VKTKDFYVSCDYIDNLSVYLRDTLVITVLKPVTKERLVKTEAFHVSCDYSDNLIV